MVRIIVKTGYMKGKMHREYYVDYIASRDGAEVIESSYGNNPATKRQKKLIENMIADYPMTKKTFEYADYLKNPTLQNASELISSVIYQNVYDIATKENYVDYISNRPNVEKIGKHGLFSSDDHVNLNSVVKEVGEHEGIVWTHIISIKREDAKRLGYDRAESWKYLCRSKCIELAEAMKIQPEHLKWYAAFHNEGHHPHIHMIVYSTDIKEGFVTRQDIDKIRSMFAREIFSHDLIQTYQKQTEERDKVKKYSKDILEKMVQNMDNPFIDNKTIFRKLKELKEELKDYQGRLMFAYIPKRAKDIINDILRELEKDSNISEAYEQWKLYKQEIVSTYRGEKLDKLPLFEQKEFKSIKNMILKEVMFMEDNELTFNEDKEEPLEKINIDDPNHLGLVTARLFHHVSRIFQNEVPGINNPLKDVDRKLKKKMLEKKLAHGIKQEAIRQN